MAYRIVLPQVARTIEALPGETILAAALREGVGYPHGCQRGRCGACKSRLVQGDVEMLSHSPFVLEAPERQEGLVLACRAVPTSDVNVCWTEAVSALPPMAPIDSIVVARHEIAPQIQRLVARPTRPLSFLPGQYVNVTLPDGLTRSYSPASQPMVQDLEFLREFQRILDVHTKVPDLALDLGMSEQNLDCTHVSRRFTDHRGLRVSKPVCAVVFVS